MAKNASQSSGDIETGSKPAFTPALLTSTSTGPSSASTVENAFATSAGELTSHRAKSVPPDASLVPSASRSSEATLAPA